MRNARVVGLSADGMTLVVTTDGGEELAIAADDGLRAAVRGDRPRLGQLENEMETSLSPRDIQTRIRSGATLEDVASVAGLPMDRVERFAAPVLAERDHVAITAMAGSVRRRGETSGHRNLRLTVTERLATRGVDLDALEWDSYRLADGRWAVTIAYPISEETHRAEFLYDPRGRFSIAGNDDARWLLGEHPPTSGPQAGQSGQSGDTEPTVDLSDELALVRATQEVGSSARTDDRPNPDTESTVAVVRTLQPAPDPPVQLEDVDEVEEVTQDEAPEPESEDAGAGNEVESPLTALYAMLSREEPGDDYAGLSATGQTEGAIQTELSVTDVRGTEVSGTELSGTELSVTERGGLSDAAAVPETTEGGGWEPAIVVNFPVEPSLVEDGLESAGDPAGLTGERAGASTGLAGTDEGLAGTDELAPPGPVVDGAGRADEVREFQLEAEVEAPPMRRPAKKKRASVPSWDEIMFGGPRPPGS